MSPIAQSSLPVAVSPNFRPLRPSLLGLELFEGLGHGEELGGNCGDRLGGEEALPKREATRITERAFEVTRPHVLDEQEAGRASGSERSRYLLDLALREPEGVALHLLRVRRQIALEL